VKKEINKQMIDYTKAYTDLWAFSGSIAAIKNGEIIFEQGFGYANVEHKVPNTSNTKFRIYSISKQFTAVAILLLEERGLLKVEDHVRKYFPDWTELDERITIHQLLTHTSGLINYSDDKDWNKTQGQNVMAKRDEKVNFFLSKPLDFEPGTSWNYCNTGYFILEVLIERLSEMSYPNFMKENIFGPLEMKDSGVYNDLHLIENKASGYYLNNYEIIPCEYVNMNNISASGGLYSTVLDMLKWDRALKSDELLTRKSIDKMNTDYQNNYGLGVEVNTVDGKQVISHDGGYRGFLTKIDRHIEDDFAIVALSNYGFTNVWRICADFAKIALEREYEMPSKPAEFALSPELLESYLGFYDEGDEDDNPLEIAQTADGLNFVIGGKFNFPIYPISENTFHQKWIDEQYTVNRDEDGSLSIWGCKKR